MTEIKIVYKGVVSNEDVEEDETREASFEDAGEAVRWVVANLMGWSLDEDVTVWVNGVPQQ